MHDTLINSVISRLDQDNIGGIDFNSFDVITEISKFKDLKPLGFQIIVRLFIEPNKKGGIFVPSKTHEEQQFQNCVGLVISMGEEAYLDKERYPLGPRCQVGDWIVFPRHHGIFISYDGIPIFIINEDTPLAKETKDPRRIKRV
jgi:co-chaperonin GroES (HSP10)